MGKKNNVAVEYVWSTLVSVQMERGKSDHQNFISQTSIICTSNNIPIIQALTEQPTKFCVLNCFSRPKFHIYHHPPKNMARYLYHNNKPSIQCLFLS